MLDKFLALLERFVVAHELIAANSAKPVAVLGEVVSTLEAAEPEQKPAAKRTRTAKPKATPEPEPEQEEEEAPKPKAKAKAKGAADIDTLRQEIKDAVVKVAAEGSDKCNDELDDLLTDYKVRNVTKLQDDDIEDFHADLEEIVSKYFEMED